MSDEEKALTEDLMNWKEELDYQHRCLLDPDITADQNENCKKSIAKCRDEMAKILNLMSDGKYRCIS